MAPWQRFVYWYHDLFRIAQTTMHDKWVKRLRILAFLAASSIATQGVLHSVLGYVGLGNLLRRSGSVDELVQRTSLETGALAGALGSEDNARKLIDALDRSNALLASLEGVSAKLGRTLDKTDARVFGTGGEMDQTQQAVEQLNATLADARASLKKADAVLAEAQKIGANTAAATEDLAALRAQIEESVRKVGGLIDEVNRKWPFKRDTELKLP